MTFCNDTMQMYGVDNNANQTLRACVWDVNSPVINVYARNISAASSPIATQFVQVLSTGSQGFIQLSCESIGLGLNRSELLTNVLQNPNYTSICAFGYLTSSMFPTTKYNVAKFITDSRASSILFSREKMIVGTSVSNIRTNFIVTNMSTSNPSFSYLTCGRSTTDNSLSNIFPFQEWAIYLSNIVPIPPPYRGLVSKSELQHPPFSQILEYFNSTEMDLMTNPEINPNFQSVANNYYFYFGMPNSAVFVNQNYLETSLVYRSNFQIATLALSALGGMYSILHTFFGIFIKVMEITYV